MVVAGALIYETGFYGKPDRLWLPVALWQQSCSDAAGRRSDRRRPRTLQMSGHKLDRLGTPMIQRAGEVISEP